MEKILKFQKKIELALVYLGGLLLLILMVLVTAESLLRKFADYSIPGIFEISSQLMVGITILGIAHVQSQGEHIKVDIFSKKLPAFVIKGTDIFVCLLGIGITALFGFQGLLKFMESYSTGETTMGIVSIPYWPGRLAIVVAMFMLCLRFITDFVLFFKPVPAETEVETMESVKHIEEKIDMI